MAKGSHYDKALADYAVSFIQCLCHTKGTWAGKPFELIDWQERIIRDLFGVVKETGSRQFNTAYIEIPKKMGKSELAAAVALLLACGDGEERAEVYGCAADRNQAKIVFDVAVDLREGSATYGKWYGVELSEENKKQFLIPEGFAHGFLVLSDEAEFCYKVNDFWHPNDEGGMAWNDPEIGIEWPELKGEYKGNASAEGYTLEDGTALNLSDKDQKWLGLKDTFKF